MPESHRIEWYMSPSRREFYLVQDADGDRIGICDAFGLINASTDSGKVVSHVIQTMGFDDPDWIDHDGEYIHFGYGEKKEGDEQI